MGRTTKCIDENNWIPGFHAHLPLNCCFCANSFTFYYMGRKSVMVTQLPQRSTLLSLFFLSLLFNLFCLHRRFLSFLFLLATSSEKRISLCTRDHNIVINRKRHLWMFCWLLIPASGKIKCGSPRFLADWNIDLKNTKKICVSKTVYANVCLSCARRMCSEMRKWQSSSKSRKKIFTARGKSSGN